MWWILLLGTMAACVWLLTRVLDLEARIAELESDSLAQRRAERISAAAAPPEPRPFHQTPPPSVTIEEPVAAPEPAVEAPTPATPQPVETAPEPFEDLSAPRRGPGFEDIFGRYLPIWAGGITLVVAGVLIVKYSIDAGLLSPMVRVIAGLLFGATLIAGAEATLRRPALVADKRIGQSLAGAGVATLYAAILVAANLYGLIGPMIAFAGLAGVTVLAAGLSLRYGAPSALLGLVGGLAAPALVESTAPNMPLLMTYLAVIVGGLCMLGRTRRWSWLGGLAVAGGFIWSMLLISIGVAGATDTLALGAYTLLVAVAFPLLLIGSERRWLQLAAALAGCAQMAALVATGGFAGLDWALFGLIAAALVWLSRREPLFAHAPLASSVTGLLLAFAWPVPDAVMLAAVLVGGALIHGAPALQRLWRTDGGLGDAAQLAIVALAIAAVPLWHFGDDYRAGLFAALALGGAALVALAAALGWNKPERRADARFALLALTAIALALFGVAQVIPFAALAPASAAAVVLALLLARRAEDSRIEHGALFAAPFALLLLLADPGRFELLRASGIVAEGDPLAGAGRWLVGLFAAAAFARWSTSNIVRALASGAAAGLGYVALAQLVPAPWLALIPALTLAALAFAPMRRETLVIPMAVTGVIAFAWAAVPLLTWLFAALYAVAGEPLLVTMLPPLADTAIRIAAPTAALFVLLYRRALPDMWRIPAVAIATALVVIVGHVGWKQLFAISDASAFVQWGMAERTLWEMLLLAAALGAWRLRWLYTALGFALASLAHFLWFTALLHDPLWTEQSVGPWLVPAYATAAAAVLLIVRLADGQPWVRRAANWVQMALILLFTVSLLRQLFHGSMISLGPVTQAEDISRSLLAILLAVGFLLWGIRRVDRDWRIASLVLMLGTVGKVFLFDAAGLDGLLRIASFIALGLSLIGVGWLYSRYLPDARLTNAQDEAE